MNSLRGVLDRSTPHNRPLNFSVIINTVERCGPLHTLLHALEQQSYPHFEVIIVVGPTTDNTLEMLSAYAGRVRLLSCSQTNLSRSRNIGLLASRGDIVVYIDDDAVPCQRWLEQYARIFEDPAKQVAGGAVWAAHPRFSMPQFRLGIYSSLAEQVDVRSSWIDEIVPRGFASRWIARVPGGNLASRRQILLDALGFDEFYQFVAEETDLALRLINAGIRISPVKEAIIYHFPASGPNRVAFTNKGRWWMRSRSRVYLGLRHGPSSGDSLRLIISRSIRSAGAHIPWYASLVTKHELAWFDAVNATYHEVISGINALFHGLFVPPQLIEPAAAEAAKNTPGIVTPFQNETSSVQPSVDPVTGRQPHISMPDPPLRLCLLSHTYPPQTYGGIARLTNLMAQGLFELGHTVHVVTKGEREEISFYDGAYVHKIPPLQGRYEHYRQYYNLHATLNYSHNVYDKIQRLILNDGIQIVDSPLWQYEGLVTLTSGIIPVVARLVTGLRQISDLHNSHGEEFALMGNLEQVFLQKVQHLLPNTQATLEAIRKFYALDAALFTADKPHCTIIPYGIVPAPEDQIRPFEPKAQDAPLTVLFVGRLEKRKGILDLFKAIPGVLKQMPMVRFVIVGNDNSKSDGFVLKTGMDYPTYFAEHYPAYLPYVQFTGSLDDEHLQRLYQSCDLFVAPSLYESFGLVYLEAMNFAKPVIGCKAGGIPEVIDHGITGWLVEPEAPKALTEAIVSLLNSPEKLRQMGLAAREQILQRFNYVQMAGKFAQVYRQEIQRFAQQFTLPP